ncbi:methylated-DNA--[protein]-cysteine S-methyltransferase [Gordonia sp. NPDC003424]
MSATTSPEDTTAAWTTLATPDGPFTVVADSAQRVLASGWTDDPTYLTALIHHSIRPDTLSPTDDLACVRDAVTAYYDGEFRALDKIEVVQHSGPFLEHAWTVLRTVTPGAPVSYRTLAELAGAPRAIRGAASACARNAAALFVPCHRVLRTDGSLGGFRYGLPIKQSLLAREAPPADGAAE